VAETVSGQNLVKSSVQRGIRGALRRDARRDACGCAPTATARSATRAIRAHAAPSHCLLTLMRRVVSSRASSLIKTAKLGEQFPSLEDSGVLDELMPKKDKMVIAKWRAPARSGGACLLQRRAARRLRAAH
jgi:hypothetical protein